MSNCLPLSEEELYLRFYQRSLKRNTPREVDFLERLCPLLAKGTVVDIPCGAGRHALELARRNPMANIHGIDISDQYINIARQEESCNAEFHVADMRTAPLPENIVLALCLHTSFGYFNDVENRSFIERVFSALRAGGKLVVDVINPEKLRPGEALFMKQGNDTIIDNVKKMSKDESHFESRYTVTQRHYARAYTLQVYTSQAFTALFRSLGGECQFYGNYDGERYHANSERLIVVATAGSSHTGVL